MEENRTRYARAYSRRECRSWRFEQYLINDRPLEHIIFAPHQTQFVSGSQGLVDQGKWWFKREGIYKNLNKEEAVYLKRELNRIASRSGQTEEEFNCWVIAGNELLLQNKDIDNSYARIKSRIRGERTDSPPARNHSYAVKSQLSSPARGFQKLSATHINTRVHFDSSFEANIWALDERGVHARNPEL